MLTQTQRIGGPQRGYYLVTQDELETFVPPVMGRPQADAASPTALAKRRSRSQAQSPLAPAVTADTIENAVPPCDDLLRSAR